MKFLLFALVCVAGVVVIQGMKDCPSETPVPRPALTLEQMSAKLHILSFKVRTLKGKMQKMKGVGKAAIAVVDQIIAKSGRNPKCIDMEVFSRPFPVPIPPPRSLVAPGPQLTAEQMSTKLYKMKHDTEGLGRKMLKFRDVGRTNIGKLNRFVEAVKKNICGHTHKSPCPVDYLAFGDSCYKEAIGRSKTWEDAQALCHAEGAHLATIESEAENEYILTLLHTTAPGHSVWIGLNRRESPNWRWVHNNEDLESDDYTKWCPCKTPQPSQKCTYLCMKCKDWAAADCGEYKRVLCQKPQIDDDEGDEGTR